MTRQHNSSTHDGFTLLELVLVISIFAVVAGLIGPRLPMFRYWHEQGMVRRLSETLVFLHHQAITDGVYYRMEFNLDPYNPYYRVGEVVPEGMQQSTSQQLGSIGSTGGLLSLELAQRLIAPMGEYQNMIAPRSFPSLKDPVKLPEGAYFAAVRTMRGKVTSSGDDEEKPYIMFSPRGFSEFAVIHIQLAREDDKVTILVNPFTGLTEIFVDDEFKEFEWTYSERQQE